MANSDRYTTKATRWYDVPMVGAVQDSTNNNWYRREEDIKITMSGTLAANVRTDIYAVPYDPIKGESVPAKTGAPA
jgi:hypothetical protein